MDWETLDRINKLYSSIVAWLSLALRAFQPRVLACGLQTQSQMQLLSITNTEFTHKYLRGLTVSLQEDIVQAVSEIKTLTSSLKENVDSYHSKWFETISAMCSGRGFVVVKVLLSMSTTKEQSQFLLWTIFLLSSTGALHHTKKQLYKVNT